MAIKSNRIGSGAGANRNMGTVTGAGSSWCNDGGLKIGASVTAAENGLNILDSGIMTSGGGMDLVFKKGEVGGTLERADSSLAESGTARLAETD